MVKSVYIHIPFCKNICNYCDFCKLLYDKKYINSYLDNLEMEINNRYKGELLDTIYIGGGTPTSLDYIELERLLKIVSKFNRSSSLEYSIESNIECLDIDKIKLLKKYGVNRVSLGVQSFNDKLLKDLGRTHNKDMVNGIVNSLRDNGIDNINIDLIYGVNADIDNIKYELGEFFKLDVRHVSCYSLIIEDYTVFSYMKRKYVDEDIEYMMYELIRNSLESNGYKQYEISNYAIDGYKSCHNINYWDNGEYYGFGLGSVSYINNNRISNTKNLSKYLKGIYIDNINYEDEIVRMENEMMLGLRKISGVNIDNFNKKYSKNIYEVFDINKLISDGKIEVVDGNIRIPKDKLYLSNEIMMEFME